MPDRMAHKVLLARGSTYGCEAFDRGAHVVPMGMANAFLIEGDDGLTLIDAGYLGQSGAWPFARPAQVANFHSWPP